MIGLELSNLSLFAHCVAATLVKTGIGPGIAILVFVRCAFPYCVRRDFHDDDHDVRIPIEHYDSAAAQQIRLFKSSGGSQLANTTDFNSSKVEIRATRLPRKVRRTA